MICVPTKPEEYESVMCRSCSDDVLRSQLLSLKGLRPFVALDGLLPVGGRLRRAKLLTDTMHQVIVPRRHPFTRLVVLYNHELSGHGGYRHVLALVQRRYWVIEAIASINHYS